MEEERGELGKDCSGEKGVGRAHSYASLLGHLQIQVCTDSYTRSHAHKPQMPSLGCYYRCTRVNCQQSDCEAGWQAGMLLNWLAD